MNLREAKTPPRLCFGGPLHGKRMEFSGARLVAHQDGRSTDYWACKFSRFRYEYEDDGQTVKRIVVQFARVMVEDKDYSRLNYYATRPETESRIKAMMESRDYDPALDIVLEGEDARVWMEERGLR